MQISKAHELFADCTRQGSYLGLERMRAIMKQLGDPQDQLKFIHIAGTNGKGSTAAMLSSILIESGYKTGLYTSPALIDFNERMQINRVSISDNDLISLIPIVRQAAFAIVDEGYELPSDYEFMTAIAFLWFQQHQCDIVVLEVGLGGTLDMTNIIKSPEAAVICAIDFDHMAELGDTLEEIASWKAGIIKHDCDVVQYQQNESVTRVIKSKCIEMNASLHIADFNKLEILSSDINGQRLNYKNHNDIFIPLAGLYQQNNTAVVLETVMVLVNKGYKITDDSLRKGLKNSVWHARFEIIQREPLFILDGGHNPHGVKALADTLHTLLPDEKFTFICGIVSGKDYKQMLSYISPMAENIITVTVPYARTSAMTADILAETASQLCENVAVCTDIPDAINTAFDLKLPVCCFGSLYLAGAVLNYFNTRRVK